jgi:hypothetical protein
MLPPSLSLILSSMCVQSIFNQPIYRVYAKIAQQQKNKMSREAPVPLLKLIRSVRMCMYDAIGDDRCVYCCRRLSLSIYIHIHLQFVAQTTTVIIHLIHLAIHHSSFQSHLDLYTQACVLCAYIYIYMYFLAR